MYIFQPDRELLKKQIKDTAPYISGVVLDVGAGPCARYQNFFNYKKYIKMDVSPGDNVDIVGSADAIPLADSSVDSVVSTQVFEHLNNPFSAAKEISRVIRKGGYLLVTVPQTNELHEEPNDYFRYTKYGLKHVFESEGFETVLCLQRGGYHTLLTQLRVRYLIDRFELYDRPVFGRIVSKITVVWTAIAVWRDKKNNSKANQKHTIGWTVLYKKI